MDEANKIVIYQTENGETQIDVRMAQNIDIWDFTISDEAMAEIAGLGPRKSPPDEAIISQQ